MNTWKLGIVALTVATLAAATPAFAKQHDSNTLSKIGHAIQYPINKAGQNASVDAHRATGHNSVEHRRNGSRTHNAVVTPKGHVYRIHHHRRHRSH